MNLLTDIIRDVATEMGIRNITEEQLITLQEDVLASIVNRVSWLKQGEVKKAEFPWIEKPREHLSIVTSKGEMAF